MCENADRFSLEEGIQIWFDCITFVDVGTPVEYLIEI